MSDFGLDAGQSEEPVSLDELVKLATEPTTDQVVEPQTSHASVETTATPTPSLSGIPFDTSMTAEPQGGIERSPFIMEPQPEILEPAVEQEEDPSSQDIEPLDLETYTSVSTRQTEVPEVPQLSSPQGEMTSEQQPAFGSMEQEDQETQIAVATPTPSFPTSFKERGEQQQVQVMPTTPLAQEQNQESQQPASSKLLEEALESEQIREDLLDFQPLAQTQRTTAGTLPMVQPFTASLPPTETRLQPAFGSSLSPLARAGAWTMESQLAFDLAQTFKTGVESASTPTSSSQSSQLAQSGAYATTSSNVQENMDLASATQDKVFEQDSTFWLTVPVTFWRQDNDTQEFTFDQLTPEEQTEAQDFVSNRSAFPTALEEYALNELGEWNMLVNDAWINSTSNRVEMTTRVVAMQPFQITEPILESEERFTLADATEAIGDGFFKTTTGSEFPTKDITPAEYGHLGRSLFMYLDGVDTILTQLS
jgi:hypothetical protein